MLAESSVTNTLSDFETCSMQCKEEQAEVEESSSSPVHCMQINELEPIDDQKFWNDTNESRGNSSDFTLCRDSYTMTHNESVKVEKWRKHCNHGKFIENTKIIPTKVFLSEQKWQDHLGIEERYTIQDLIEYSNKNQIKIGLIIDLNRSFDYYDFARIQQEDTNLTHIKYMKFKMDTDIPSEELINAVFNELTMAHANDEGVIIHCFNGLNRTGFIVVDFLCRALGLSLDDALDRFETARGHRIENEVLKQALNDRFRSE
jgi:atypical dual specificity phosphatase